MPKNYLTFAQVTVLLSGCTRNELVDHTFGDAEFTWVKDGKIVADGYFGSSSDSVGSHALITDTEEQKAKRWKFDGHLAKMLRRLGTLGERERNDCQGRDDVEEADVEPLTDEEFWA